jgi:hypothetical protein
VVVVVVEEPQKQENEGVSTANEGGRERKKRFESGKKVFLGTCPRAVDVVRLCVCVCERERESERRLVVWE